MIVNYVSEHDLQVSVKTVFLLIFLAARPYIGKYIKDRVLLEQNMVSMVLLGRIPIKNN